MRRPDAGRSNPPLYNEWLPYRPGSGLTWCRSYFWVQTPHLLAIKPHARDVLQSASAQKSGSALLSLLDEQTSSCDHKKIHLPRFAGPDQAHLKNQLVGTLSGALAAVDALKAPITVADRWRRAARKAALVAHACDRLHSLIQEAGNSFVRPDRLTKVCTSYQGDPA